MRYYPVFLDLNEKACVVIGGGRVAERKVLTLLKAGARVTVVSPRVTEALRRLKEKGKIAIRRDSFRATDLKAVHLAIAATDDRAVNEQVFRKASHLRIPVNVVDDPKHCSFIVPSIISRGDILLAISTGGLSPALAKALRKKLQSEIGQEYTVLLKIMALVRKRIMTLGWGEREKRKIIRPLLKEDLLRMIRRKRGAEIETFIKKNTGFEILPAEIGLNS
jgi:precorrin-2 dehydrogenase / sirohydrochlorin ferrochelatase